MKLLLLLLALCLASCSQGVHWEIKKNGYTHYSSNWGQRGSCNTYGDLPIKRGNYNRYAYYKHRNR